MPSLNFADAWPWLQWVIAVLAVGAFVAACLKGIPSAWKFLSRTVVTINSLGGLPEFIERTDASVAQMKQQILNSHGDINLRDELTEALESSKRAEEMLTDVQSKLANDDIRITKLQARDEQGRFTKKDSGDS